DIPDPVRPIAHDYSEGGAVPTPVPSLRINTETKLFGGFNRADVRRRTLIPQRPAPIIDIGLRKHGAQFAFAGSSGLAWGSTGPAFGLSLHHKHLRPIHLHVQVRNRRASHGRKMELLGVLDTFLLPDLNISADRFGGPLNR